MFEMRPDHVKAFEAAQLNRFEERAAAHARRTLPEETAQMSEEQLQARIRREMHKAQSYGLTTERQIFSFLDAGLMLGEGFDTNYKYPWVRQVLEDPERDSN